MFTATFQSELPPAIAQNHRLFSAFGFDFLLNTCSVLIAEILPESQNGKQIDGPKENYPNFSYLLVSEAHN
jgi:hypothetical protein